MHDGVGVKIVMDTSRLLLVFLPLGMVALLDYYVK